MRYDEFKFKKLIQLISVFFYFKIDKRNQQIKALVNVDDDAQCKQVKINFLKLILHIEFKTECSLSVSENY